MKLQSNNLLENLAKDELKNLAIQLKETVAKEFNNDRKRIFRAAQLWDIQRRERIFLVKRILF